MKMQNKKAEMAIGPQSIRNEWLEDPVVYNIKRIHLAKLQLLPSKDLLILDAGCGPGVDGIILANEGGAKVVGIDISENSVKVANDSAIRKDGMFVSLVGDIEVLPFKDNSFDICYCSWAMHHFPDIKTAITELYRCLKPGGKIALVEPNESNPAMRLSRFIEDLPLLRRSILKAGWDTPNRTVHYARYYLDILKQQGFKDIKMGSCYAGSGDPMLNDSKKNGWSLFSVFFHLRVVIFSMTAKAWPRPLNGTDLLIIGIK